MKKHVTKTYLTDLISDTIKSTLKEVRYIDVGKKPVRVDRSNNMWEDYDEFKNKLMNDMRAYFKWNATDMSAKANNQIALYLEPMEGTDRDAESVANYLRSMYKFRHTMSIQPKGNGLYVSFYLKNDSNLSPIGKGEKIRVFHGTDIKTAIKIAKNGLSGKERATRTYSYEYGMNPNGLFVTTNFYVAKEFGYHYDDQVILEFTVDSNDLDTPVWNGQDSYFGQMSNPQPFLNRSERVIQKNHYQSMARMSEFPYVAQSENPAMADRIFNNNENQALYYGDLMPNQIKRFWWKQKGTENFIPLTYRQFMRKFADYSYNYTEYGRSGVRTIEKEKVYWPNEDWMGPEDFVEHMKRHELAQGRTWDKNDEQWCLDLARRWEGIAYGEGDLDMSNQHMMSQILYPKQIVTLLGLDGYRKYFDRFYPEFRER